MAMSPHMLAMLMLEKPQVLAQLAASKGIEPPETPEEATEKLKDPSLSPQDRERLQGIAAGLKGPEAAPGDYSTTIPEAAGQAGSALMSLAPQTGNQPLQSAKDEQNSLRGRDGTVANALAGTQQPQGQQPRRGFDPDAPQAPTIPAAQAPSPASPPQAPSAPQPTAAAPAAQPATPSVNINVAPAAPQGPNPMAPNPSMVGAVPPQGAMPPAPAAAAAPVAPAMDPWAAALAGVAQSSAAAMRPDAPRAPGAVAPYNPGALQPQTLAIIQALSQQAGQGGAPSLQALLNGAR